MASLSITHSFPTKPTSQHLVNPRSYQTKPTLVTCQTPVRFGPPSPKPDNEKRVEVKKQTLMEVFVGVEKLARGIKESLSPKHKGDWKDLVLMSLSFAIYVYISQKIVCAYCAWMSMFENHW